MLDAAPSGLLFTLGVNGKAPPSQSFVVKNLRGGSLGFTAAVSTTKGVDWLRTSSGTGVAPTTITVTATPGSPARRVYNGAVTITPLPAAGASNGPLVLPVSLSVNAPAIRFWQTAYQHRFSTSRQLRLICNCRQAGQATPARPST